MPEPDRFAEIQSRISDLVAQGQYQTRIVIARIRQLENTVATKLADIETKLDQLDTMLSAKAASDDADLTAVSDKLDGIIAKHATPATSTGAAALDPVTGLPVE